ncbi:hypothetical protein NB700_001809 [Xanthomonas sacchari]|uniref:Uncharacterized protein n=2 Tax=Xanthomonas TaxID=338 RepID=A0ABT3DUS5_9XANT|nr:hypothetical protein [Xanthomonas sacchari]
MTSVSGRFLQNPNETLVRGAVDAAFGQAPYPLHEVDAHVLQGLVAPLEPDFSHADPRVMELVRGTLGTLSATANWIVYLTDTMTGPSPLAALLLSVHLQQVQSQTHCTLAISALKQLQRPPSLPYDLRRAATRGLSEVFWSAMNNTFVANEEGYLGGACVTQLRRVG